MASNYISKDGDQDVRIVMVGDGGVGKSCITLRLIGASFEDDYDPTIEDSYSFQRVVDDRPINGDLLDTAGQDDFKSMRDSWLETSDAVIIVYSVQQRTTFAEAKSLYTLTLNTKDTDKFPIILVANKQDLSKRHHKVTSEEGKALAGELDIPFCEVSAKKNTGITELFEACVRAFREHRAAGMDQLNSPPRKEGRTLLPKKKS
mmetsp:Transcript_20070/g.29843  ORF Transcript_20070/g.29843 Transcript_20070/m.29843 type:complete len:204 (+) Transcript_20070:71-682(+)